MPQSNTIEIMRGKKYFSILDLYSEFFQVSVHKHSREKQSFITSWEPYSYNAAPQGALGLSSTFTQQTFSLLSAAMSPGKACIYIDNWLLSSKAFEEDLDLLRTVLTRLCSVGLKYRFSKNCFCQKQITCLDHIITQEGIAVAPHNTIKIANFSRSKHKSGVRRLLGLFGLYLH